VRILDVCMCGGVQLWSAGEISSTVITEQSWFPVMSALLKTERLAEVFPLAHTLQSLVLADADAEIILHGLVGVASTVEYVSSCCCSLYSFPVSHVVHCRPLPRARTSLPCVVPAGVHVNVAGSE
jgi:hypothetical protein